MLRCRMDPQATFTVVLGSAIAVAALHTLIGVDHTLPFVAIGRAQRWPLRRVLALTALCGAGHVLSSIVLGLLGIALGTALSRLQALQEMRSSLAAWILIAFGSLLAVRGLVGSLQRRPHSHVHVHEDGSVHEHPHEHVHAAHQHPHPQAGRSALSTWTLFVIFVLGPCEALIPLMMAPAALEHWWGVVIVASVFSVVTVAVMLAVVAAVYAGLSTWRAPALQRHAELLSGLAVLASGLAIEVLGL
jgi:ABC-type nickel/cobalt efflux system permease component RcnA